MLFNLWFSRVRFKEKSANRCIRGKGKARVSNGKLFSGDVYFSSLRRYSCWFQYDFLRLFPVNRRGKTSSLIKSSSFSHVQSLDDDLTYCLKKAMLRCERKRKVFSVKLTNFSSLRLNSPFLNPISAEIIKFIRCKERKWSCSDINFFANRSSMLLLCFLDFLYELNLSRMSINIWSIFCAHLVVFSFLFFLSIGQDKDSRKKNSSEKKRLSLRNIDKIKLKRNSI